MSQQPPAYGPLRTRPTIVTVASCLLVIAAALAIADIVLSYHGRSVNETVYQQAVADGSVPAENGVAFEAVGIVANLVAVALKFLAALSLLVLGPLNSRGHNPARIVTWVVAGPLLCCSGSLFAFSSIDVPTTSPMTAADAELERRFAAALPLWYDTVSTAVEMLLPAALLAAIILLALPAANTFFRPRRLYDPAYPDWQTWT
jgi:K+-transporting ATPase A subunit